MVGTLGILYNKKLAALPVDSWTSLWDIRHRGGILMWDSMRDVIGPTLKMLGYSVNSGEDEELAQVKERLIAQRPLVHAYAGDAIRDMMIADEGMLAVIYSGDAKTAIDQNPNLAYVIPKEGSNKWVDGFAILKDSGHMETAHAFINFMCSPHIAIRNMTQTGYTSPVFSIWGEFGSNVIMFPVSEELDRCEAFLYDKDATLKYEMLWQEVRGR
jgi:spermidine/putrescine-binding protein